MHIHANTKLKSIGVGWVVWVRGRCCAAGIADDYEEDADLDFDDDDGNYTQKLLTTKRIDGNKFIIVGGGAKNGAPKPKEK